MFLKSEEEKMKKYNEAMTIDEEKVKRDIMERWEKWLIKYNNRLLEETAALQKEDFEESKGSESKVKTRFGSLEELETNRIKKMNATNPIYVLRNYMAEEAIQKAEKGDYSGVNYLLEILLNPFDSREEQTEGKIYQKCPPKWAAEICVSCSS